VRVIYNTFCMTIHPHHYYASYRTFKVKRNHQLGQQGPGMVFTHCLKTQQNLRYFMDANGRGTKCSCEFNTYCNMQLCTPTLKKTRGAGGLEAPPPSRGRSRNLKGGSSGILLIKGGGEQPLTFVLELLIKGGPDCPPPLLFCYNN
jgi:hypothetical protein